MVQTVLSLPTIVVGFSTMLAGSAIASDCPSAEDLKTGVLTEEKGTRGSVMQVIRRVSADEVEVGSYVSPRQTEPESFILRYRGFFELGERNKYEPTPAEMMPFSDTQEYDHLYAGSFLAERRLTIDDQRRVKLGECSYDAVGLTEKSLVMKFNGTEAETLTRYVYIPELMIKTWGTLDTISSLRVTAIQEK